MYQKNSDDNLNPQKIEQASSFLGDYIATTINRLYSELVSKGFDANNAVRICCAWVHGQAGGKLQ